MVRERVCCSIPIHIDGAAARAQTLTDLVVFVNSSAVALLFGSNVGSFMEALREQAGIDAASSGLSGNPLLEKAFEAVSAVKVAAALTSVRDAARAKIEAEPARQDPDLLGAKETYFKLAAMLAVLKAESDLKWDPDEWNLSEAVRHRHRTAAGPFHPRVHPVAANSRLACAGGGAYRANVCRLR